MNKPSVILTVGISNSGKSTIAKEFIENNPNFVELNRDDIRIAFFCNGDRMQYCNYKFSKDNEQMVTDVIKVRAATAMRRGQGIFISDTNLNPKFRSEWERFAEMHNREYEEIDVDVPLSVCLKRNLKRDITLPPEVIKSQYKAYRAYKGMKTYSGTEGKPSAIIVDIDGTVADNGTRGPFEWGSVIKDKPRLSVVDAVRAMDSDGYQILYVTSRDKECECDTWVWLCNHIGEPSELFMRTKGDRRQDSVVKEEIFWKHIAEEYDVKFVLEDRSQMVDHWRSMGLECWQVAAGEF